MVALAVTCTLYGRSDPAQAATFSPGNLLIVTQDYVPGVYPSKIVEMTPSGTVAQTIPIPRPGDDEARDLVVDGQGRAHVFNGTFDPFLSTYDPASAIWSNHTYAGWSIINNTTYGGIAVTGDAVFATDEATFGPGDLPSGIVRFSLLNFTGSRFAEGQDYIDLTLGLDGLLYALGPSGSPGGTTLDVYSPASMSLVRSVELPFGLSPRGVAVDGSGRIFTAGFSDIRRFSPQGVVEKSATTTSLIGGFHNLGDIDIDPSGRLVMGGWCGEVIVSDSELDPAHSSLIQLPYCFEVFTTWVPGNPATPIAHPTTWGELKARYH